MGAACTFQTEDLLTYNTNRKYSVVVDRGCMAILNDTHIEKTIIKIHELLEAEGYFFLKIDAKKEKELKIFEQLNSCFASLHIWNSAYDRNDGASINTKFYIGRKLSAPNT